MAFTTLTSMLSLAFLVVLLNPVFGGERCSNVGCLFDDDVLISSSDDCITLTDTREVVTGDVIIGIDITSLGKCLANLREIDGNLEIQTGTHSSNSVQLLNLKTVGGDIIVQGTSTFSKLMLPNLQKVGGSVTIENNRDLTTVVLTALKGNVTSLSVVTNPELLALDLDNLGIVTDDAVIHDNEALTAISCNALTYVGGELDIRQESESDDGVLSSVDLSSLVSVNTLYIRYHKVLDRIEFPALQTVDSELHVKLNTALRTVSFPSLERCGSILFYQGTALKNVSMPLLSTVSGPFDVGFYDTNVNLGHSNLKDLNLDSLRVAGSFRIKFVGLEKLSLPALLFVRNIFQVTENSILNTILVPRLTDIGTEIGQGQLILDGNNVLTSLSLESLDYLGNTFTVSDCPALASVLVPNVQQTGAIEVSGCENLKQLNMTSLKYVFGSLVLNDILGKLSTLVLSDLIFVYSEIEFSNLDFELKTLSLPSLACVGESVMMSGLSSLKEINMPSLLSIGKRATCLASVGISGATDADTASLTCSNNLNLERFVAPSLRLIDSSCTFKKLQALTTLNLNGLVQIQDSMQLEELESLVNADFPALQRCTEIELSSNKNLLKLNYSSLIEVALDLVVTANDALTTICMSDLTKVGNSFRVTDCPQVTILDVNTLEFIGGIFDVESVKMSSMSFPSLNEVAGLSFTANEDLLSIFLVKLAPPDVFSVPAGIQVAGSATFAGQYCLDAADAAIPSFTSLTGNTLKFNNGVGWVLDDNTSQETLVFGVSHDNVFPYGTRNWAKSTETSYDTLSLTESAVAECTISYSGSYDINAGVYVVRGNTKLTSMCVLNDTLWGDGDSVEITAASLNGFNNFLGCPYFESSTSSTVTTTTSSFTTLETTLTSTTSTTRMDKDSTTNVKITGAAPDSTATQKEQVTKNEVTTTTAAGAILASTPNSVNPTTTAAAISKGSSDANIVPIILGIVIGVLFLIILGFLVKRKSKSDKVVDPEATPAKADSSKGIETIPPPTYAASSSDPRYVGTMHKTTPNPAYAEAPVNTMRTPRDYAEIDYAKMNQGRYATPQDPQYIPRAAMPTGPTKIYTSPVDYAHGPLPLVGTIPAKGSRGSASNNNGGSNIGDSYLFVGGDGDDSVGSKTPHYEYESLASEGNSNTGDSGIAVHAYAYDQFGVNSTRKGSDASGYDQMRPSLSNTTDAAKRRSSNDLKYDKFKASQTKGETSSPYDQMKSPPRNSIGSATAYDQMKSQIRDSVSSQSANPGYDQMKPSRGSNVSSNSNSNDRRTSNVYDRMGRQEEPPSSHDQLRSASDQSDDGYNSWNNKQKESITSSKASVAENGYGNPKKISSPGSDLVIPRVQDPTPLSRQPGLDQGLMLGVSRTRSDRVAEQGYGVPIRDTQQTNL